MQWNNNKISPDLARNVICVKHLFISPNSLLLSVSKSGLHKFIYTHKKKVALKECEDLAGLDSSWPTLAVIYVFMENAITLFSFFHLLAPNYTWTESLCIVTVLQISKLNRICDYSYPGEIFLFKTGGIIPGD